MFGCPRAACPRMRQGPAAVPALPRTGHSAAASASGLAWAGRDAHRNRGDVLASLPEERVTGELQGRLSARLLRFASRRSSSAARSLEIGDALKVMAGAASNRCPSLLAFRAPERQLLAPTGHDGQRPGRPVTWGHLPRPTLIGPS